MSATKAENQYHLGRDWLESVRLNAQHDIWYKATGWLLHPRVTEYVKTHERDTNFQVADVACGTGCVALELHEQFHDLKITALDLSSSQFPPGWTVPTSVTFGELDLLQDIPENYVGVFDVVHIRLVMSIIYLSGKEKLVQNLKSMLKPGGWLQWTETYPPCFSEVDPQTLELTGVPTPWSTATKPLRLLLSATWLKDLDKLVTEHGFVDAESVLPPWKRSLAQEMTNLVVFSMVHSAKALAKFLPPEGVAELEKEFEAIENNVRQGKQYGYHFVTMIARKPAS